MSSAICSPRALGFAHQEVEILDRAELRMQRLVPALAAPIAQGLPTSPGCAATRVVLALARGDADRMHRRQVEHVEAELLDVRQHLEHALEAAEGAREELVPGAEARSYGFDHDFQNFGESGGPVFHGWRQLRRHRRVEVLDLRAQQLRADLQVDGQVLPGLLALLEVALPGEERIGPAAHRVLVAAELLDAGTTPPNGRCSGNPLAHDSSPFLVRT